MSCHRANALGSDQKPRLHLQRQRAGLLQQLLVGRVPIAVARAAERSCAGGCGAACNVAAV